MHQAQRLESFLRLRELRSGSLRSVLSFCRWGGEGFVQNLRDGGQGCAVSVQVLEMLVEALEARGERRFAPEWAVLASAAYAPEQERGVRFDDPFFAINWPIAPVEMSDKDRSWPLFDPAYHAVERLRGLIGKQEAA